MNPSLLESQQDSLLAAVETGDVTLIGATTENPSFEVIRPLLSRCQVYVLEPLTDEDLLSLLHHAIEDDLVLREANLRCAKPMLCCVLPEATRANC